MDYFSNPFTVYSKNNEIPSYKKTCTKLILEKLTTVSQEPIRGGKLKTIESEEDEAISDLASTARSKLSLIKEELEASSISSINGGNTSTVKSRSPKYNASIRASALMKLYEEAKQVIEEEAEGEDEEEGKDRNITSPKMEYCSSNRGISTLGNEDIEENKGVIIKKDMRNVRGSMAT
jgi:hypothetical protein